MKTHYQAAGKTYHMCVDIKDAMECRELRSALRNLGQPMADDEALALLVILQASGHRVIPMTGCDNFDREKGCLGHAS